VFKRIDCLRLPVNDLEAALAFYRDALGHELVWRTESAAGLRICEGSEIVVHTEGDRGETDLLVDDVAASVDRIVAAGGKLLAGPFDIQIGRCAVMRDPWGNELVILDMSKGALKTDAKGNVVGNVEPHP
jgi:predicted enzyme related to lactoylglutathione lyase